MGQLCSTQCLSEKGQSQKDRQHPIRNSQNSKSHYLQTKDILPQPQIKPTALNDHEAKQSVADIIRSEPSNDVGPIELEPRPVVSVAVDQDEISPARLLTSNEDAKNKTQNVFEQIDTFEEEKQEQEYKREAQIPSSESHVVNKQAENPSGNEIEEDLCVICLESFKNLGQEPTLTVCAHRFCRKCLTAALAIKPNCPLCRRYQPRNLLRPGEDDDGLEERLGEQEPISESDWNVETVRARLNEHVDEEGFRRVVLSDGEETNIYLKAGANVYVSPNANITIGGKRIENPQDCNVQ